MALTRTPYFIEGVPIFTEPPRQDFGVRVLEAFDAAILNQKNVTYPTIADLRHPDYRDCSLLRLCWECSEEFIQTHLHKFSRREHHRDFERRKLTTPIPAFAKAAVVELINRIAQRLVDVTRVGGPQSYLDCSNGLQGGVDNNNSSMNWFTQRCILPELLPLGAAAVYVDSPPTTGPTLADRRGHPYLYSYSRENILSWAYGDNHQLTQVLLRDFIPVIDPVTRLPIQYEAQYRYVYFNTSRTVSVAFYDADGKIKNNINLALQEFPVHIYQLSEALMEVVARHQIALLNLESSDINQLLQAFPLYTEQRDSRFETSHIKKNNLPQEVNDKLPPEMFFQDDESEDHIKTGPAHGRIYGAGLERPNFVAPPMGPVEASIKKQAALKDDIRNLLNLTIANIRSASVESRAKGDEPTEAGLVAIGTELEHGERAIARIWAAYEGSRSPTAIKYPTFYYLKPDSERIDEATKLSAHLDDVPSITYRRSMQFLIAKTLLQNKIPDDDLIKIADELTKAEVPTANGPELIKDVQEGLVSHATASKARGYPEKELQLVAEEYAARLQAIAQSQAKNPNPVEPTNPTGLDNPAARGLSDLSPNPSKDAAAEKTGAPGRGPDQSPRQVP